MEPRDDIHYIDQVISGQTEAFAVLVDRHKDMVFTLALNISRNREDAEEIAQDAFMKAYGKLASFRRDSRFSTWLYRIVYNEAVTRMRKRKLQTVALEDEIMENTSDGEVEDEIHQMDETEQKAVIAWILDSLPVTDRVLVTLFYLESQTIGEISQVTGMGESNVKVRLHRTRKKLFASLHQYIEQKDYNFIK